MAPLGTVDDPNQSKPMSDQLRLELKALEEDFVLQSSRQGEQLDETFLKEACDTVYRIRCLLLDAPTDSLIKDDFRRFQGFETLLCLVDVLSEGSHHASQKQSHAQHELILRLLKSLLDVLAEVLKEHNGNRQYFSSHFENGGWDSLEKYLTRFDMLKNRTPYSFQTQKYFFGMLFTFTTTDESLIDMFRGVNGSPDEHENFASSGSESALASQAGKIMIGETNPKVMPADSSVRDLVASETVWHPEMLQIIFSLLEHLLPKTSGASASTRQVVLAVLIALTQIVQSSFYNAIRVQSTSLQSRILAVLLRDTMPREETIALRELLSETLRFGIDDLSILNRLCHSACSSDEASALLLQSIRLSQQPSAFHFDLSLHGYASMEFGEVKEPFPPHETGYSLQMWLKVAEFDDSCHSTLFGALTQDQSCFLLLYIELGTRQLVLQTSVTGSRPSVRFKSMTFAPGIWYHIAITHKPSRSKTSSHATLFVDGLYCEQLKCYYPGSHVEDLSDHPGTTHRKTGNQGRNNPTQAFIGTPHDLSPRLGRGVLKSRISIASLYLLSMVLPEDLIYVYKTLGPSYVGNFQDCLGSFQTYKGSADLNLRNETRYPPGDESSLITRAVRYRAGNINPEANVVLGVSPLMAMSKVVQSNKALHAITKLWPRLSIRTLKSYLNQASAGIVLNLGVPDQSKALQRSYGVGILTGGSIWYANNPVCESIGRVSGCVPVAVKLVQSAVSKDGLVRAVTIFFELVRTSWRNSETTERENGFSAIALLLERKMLILTSDMSRDKSKASTDKQNGSLHLTILKLILNFVGYDEVSHENTLMLNPLAYSKLVIETTIWRRSDQETQSLYYRQFEVFAAPDTKHSAFNLKRLKQMRITKKLIDSLDSGLLNDQTLPLALRALRTLIERTLSSDVHRSIALFVTFYLHRGHSVTGRESTIVEDYNPTITGLDLEKQTSTRTKNTVQGAELGVAVLEMYATLLCQGPPAESHINKFVKSVSNKWLLHLFVESDKRVILAGLKILAKLTLNKAYISKFETKVQGFVIMRPRLANWWHVNQVWTAVLSLLLGFDEMPVDSSELLNVESLIKAHLHNAKPLYFPMVPVALAMLEMGFKTYTATHMHIESNHSQGLPVQSPNLQLDKIESGQSWPLLLSVLDFFTMLTEQSAVFREHASESGLTKDLLKLYSLLQEPFALETESGKSTKRNNGEEEDYFEDRESTSSSSRPLTPSAMTRLSLPWRRASSYVVITRNEVQQLRSIVIQQPLLPPLATRPVRHSLLSERLMKLLTSVLKDQVLHRKDFGGLGLFPKAPPGTDAERAELLSQVVHSVLVDLAADLDSNPVLFTETRCLTNISRMVRQLGEAVFEGWLITRTHSLLAFIARCIERLQSSELSNVKNVRLCKPIISDIQQVFRRVALLSLSATTQDYLEIPSDKLVHNLLGWWHVWTNDQNDIPLLGPLCYVLYEKLTSGSMAVSVAACEFWRLVLAHGSEEITTVLSEYSEDRVRNLVIELTHAVHADISEFPAWLHTHRQALTAIFDEYPRATFAKFVAEENAHTAQSANVRTTKRQERLRVSQTSEHDAVNVCVEADQSAEHWIANICAAELLRSQRTQQDSQDSQAAVEASLIAVLSKAKQIELSEVSNNEKMQLDEVEGRDRMRLRLIPAGELGEVVYKPKRLKSSSVSTFTGSVKTESISSGSAHKNTTQILPDHREEQETPSGSNPDKTATSLGDDFEVVSNPHAERDMQDDKNRRVLRSLQRGEQVQSVHNIARIKGLEPQEGLLIVGKKCVYLVDELFQRADGEIVSTRHAPQEERDAYLQLISGNALDVQKAGGQDTNHSQVTRHWKWTEVISVSKRRFLLRDVALEVFFSDGLSYLLTTATTEKRNALYSDVLTWAPQIKNPVLSITQEDSWRIALLPNPRDETGMRSKISTVFGSTSAIAGTDQWLKGEISNFHYLMLVNTAAGRTFNDLTQYPVFPWVLADYHSDNLDLSDPRSFRDLTKPMGCQNSDREAAFQERYQMFAEMTDHQEPAFHYGTHYSSAMIVTSYLIRLQPFVQSYLLLQGGSFDHADRLFSSIETAWLSASRDNMTDVRELTPEFFYLPEFLVNSNQYDFGSTQSSATVVNDVRLPPWANHDPAVFVRKHREALESPFVTRNLHYWIDLVFGHAQRGEAAVEATNVFHHLSYQGARDLDKIEDHRDRLATIGIIHNFGQTPRQLFVRPHEGRTIMAPEGPCSDHALRSLALSRAAIFETHSQVSELTYSNRKQSLIYTDPFKTFVPPNNSSYVRWNYSDRSLRFFDSESNRLLATFEQLHADIIVSARFIDSKTLMTASRDCTIAIWTIDHESSNVDLQLQATLLGHREPITSMALSTCLRTVVSVSAGDEVLVWDINRFEILRRLSVRDTVVDVRINDVNGNIVLCTANKLLVYTINGRLLAERQIDMPHDQTITSCAVYQGQHGEWLPRDLIFTGHSRGTVAIWSLGDSDLGVWEIELVHSLQAPDRKSGNGNTTTTTSAITCILPIRNEVFVGDEDGRGFQWKSRLS